MESRSRSSRRKLGWRAGDDRINALKSKNHVAYPVEEGYLDSADEPDCDDWTFCSREHCDSFLKWRYGMMTSICARAMTPLSTAVHARRAGKSYLEKNR